MRRALAILLVLLVGIQPTVLRAHQASQGQNPPAAMPAPTPAPLPGMPQATIDPAALGVSFDRIKAILGDQKPTDDKNGMKLNFFVEVMALAPPIQIFTKEDVAPIGPVPWGAPTHAEMLDHITRPEFKSGTIPVLALSVLGIQKLIEWETNRLRREKAEEDRRKADEEERKRQQQAQDTSLIIKK